MTFSRNTRYALTAVAVAAVLGLILVIRQYNQADQARFNVDILDQFIQSYRVIEGRQIESLSDVPDFHIISPYKSLSVRGSDIRGKMFGGYIYDMAYSGNGQYVISASPIGFLAPQVEFGVTEKGLLAVNTRNVDVQPDSREEVEHWKWLNREVGVRTKDLPAYLR